MKITRYVHTSKRKVFLEAFYTCAYLSFFGLMGLLGVTYSNYELTKAKRAGGWLGFLFSIIAFLVFFACLALVKPNVNAAIACGIAVFVLYTIFLIVFGLKYKVK